MLCGDKGKFPQRIGIFHWGESEFPDCADLASPAILLSNKPPDPNEAGWKDTLKMYPGAATRLVIRWVPQDVEVGKV